MKIVIVLAILALIMIVAIFNAIKHALKNGHKMTKKKEIKIEKTSADNLVNHARASGEYKRRIQSFTDSFFSYTDSKLKEFYSGAENRNRPSDN